LLNPTYTGSSAKYIKREKVKEITNGNTAYTGEYYWVLEEGGDEKLRSSISKCPMDADKWGTTDYDWHTSECIPDVDECFPGTFRKPDDSNRAGNGFPKLEIMCSRGNVIMLLFHIHII